MTEYKTAVSPDDDQEWHSAIGDEPALLHLTLASLYTYLKNVPKYVSESQGPRLPS
jgi:hypothetical protein